MDKELKDDSRYVKGFARLTGNKNGRQFEKILPHKKCTAEDLEHFAPPAPDSVGLLEVYKTSQTRKLYCLDWENFGDDLAI